MNGIQSEQEQIVQLSNKLIDSVRVTVCATSSPDDRKGAYEFIEKIKDDFKCAIPCGLYLWTRNDDSIKHLGLQLLEGSVKYHWNDLSIQEKLLTKNNATQLLTNNTGSEYPVYIKNKISCLYVEMAKREWPQQWPELLQDLKIAADVGPTQAEIVMLILMRLVEDTAVLTQNINSTQRKHDIHMALNQNLNFMYDLFFTLLERHYTQYKSLEADPVAAKLHSRVTQVVYETLGVVSDWAETEYVMNHKEKLFFSICQLITDKNIRQSAVNCFLTIVSKKTKVHHLLILFDQSVMDAILNAAKVAVMDEITEENNLFLKTLFQVLTTLGTQLCLVWGKEDVVTEPASFPVYLAALLSFSEHPSLVLFNFAAVLFTQLLKHEKALASSSLADVIPRWISLAGSKVRKHGYPSKCDSETCRYSAIEFDNDFEYNSFFHKVRSNIISGLRMAAVAFPDVCWELVKERFKACITMSDECPLLLTAPLPEEYVDASLLTPSQVEWEALAVIMEAIVPRFLATKEYKSKEIFIKDMFLSCLKYQSSDPVRNSYVLSCISALIPYLFLLPTEAAPVLIEKLFSVFRHKLPPKMTAPTVDALAISQREITKKMISSWRSHASSVYVILCKNYSSILIPHFDWIESAIRRMFESDDFEISLLETGHLSQGLVYLNNSKPTFAEQEAFLEKLLNPLKEEWKSVIGADFVSLIGLDAAPVADPQVATSDIVRNRVSIQRGLNLVYSIARAIKPPEERSVAINGGFVSRYVQDYFVCKSPATQSFLALLPTILYLFKAHNQLFQPGVSSRFSTDYKTALEIPVSENLSLLNLHCQNIVPVCTNKAQVMKSSLEKMRIYLKVIHELMCDCLCYLVPCLGEEFYTIANLKETFLNSMMLNFTNLPDFKIKKLIKTAFRAVTSNCPQELHETFNLPVIHHFCINVGDLLNKRWEYVSSITQSEFYDENASEMIDLVVIQSVTREFLDLMRELLVMKPGNYESVNGAEDENGMMEDTDMEIVSKGPGFQVPLTSFGKLVVACDVTFQSFVLTLCKALSWNDSISSRKANSLLQLSISTMLEVGQQHLTEDVVKHMLISILAGIHVHGQEMNNLGPLVDSILLMYHNLALHFSVLKEILFGLTGVKAEMIANLDKSMTENPLRRHAKSTKFRRDAMKKIVAGIIGKNISETFQKEVQIKDLQPMFRNPRPKQPRLDDGDSNLHLCKLFDPQSTR